MIDKPLEAIEAADIESLCFRRAPESRSLEFKRQLPGKADGEVKEFLDDVTSLANAQGGDLIFGIDAVKGLANEVALIELPDRDAEFLRLENILRDSIQPRLTVHLHWIPYEPNRGVVLIRIPPSLAFPHMRFYRGSTRFCGRNSGGKYDMDIHELRQAFTQSERLPKRFRILHDEALRKARGEEMPFKLIDGPTAVVTVAPLGLFRDQRDLPITPEKSIVPPKPEGGLNFLRTIDGVLTSTPVNEQRAVRSFVLTHRNGQVDAAWTIGGRREIDRCLKTLVWPKSFEDGLADVTGAASARLSEFGIVGPWVVLVTVFGIHGSELVKGHFLSRPAWSKGATLAELVTEDLKPEALEPIFRALWLMFGEERPPQEPPAA